MKTNSFFLFVLLFFADRFVMSQEWTKAVGDITGTTLISSLSLQNESSILVAGGFNGTNLQLGTNELKNSGEMDAWVATVDLEGNFLWAQNFGGTGNDMATAAVKDAAGNTYISGNFSSLSITIGDTTLINKGESDGFVLKMKPDKSIEWVTTVATNLKDEIIGLVLDKDGYLYIGGHSLGGFTSNSEVAFIIKIDQNKTIQWNKKSVLSTGTLSATSIVLNNNGICYLAGGFNGNLKPDGGSMINSEFNSSGYVVAYNAEGVFQKGISIDNIGKINSLKTFGNDVLICGEKINYGFGWNWPLSDSKVFVVKYDQDLNKLWEKSAGGTVQMQSLDIAKNLATDVQGNVYVTGYFFSPKLGFAGDSMPNVFNKDYFYQQIFVLKYDINGNEIWGKSFGGNLSESGDALLALDNGKWLLAGQFESDVLNLQDTILLNNGKVTEYYVHLKPKRFGRSPISFLSLFNNISSGIRDDFNISDLQFYPNPTSDILSIHSKSFGTPIIKVSIFTTDGRLVQEEQLSVHDNSAQFSISSLTTGVYIITVETDNMAASIRIIKK